VTIWRSISLSESGLLAIGLSIMRANVLTWTIRGYFGWMEKEVTYEGHDGSAVICFFSSLKKGIWVSHVGGADKKMEMVLNVTSSI